MADKRPERTIAYSKLARIYDAIYGFKDYAKETQQIDALIQQHKRTDGKKLLDVGCGTGGHLTFLRERYDVEGLDLSAEQIEVARANFPAIQFHVADMVEFALEKRFDAITCLFSAIGYVQTVDKLQQAVDCMARHLRPGGVLIVEPWLRRAVYRVGHISSDFVDKPDLKIARMCVSALRDNVSVMDMHYMVATPDGVEIFMDRHELGMFSHEEFVSAFEAAGMTVTHDELGLIGRGLYIGVREEYDE